MLLYDPRKLAAPWDKTSCSGSHVVTDLHWQHTSFSKASSKGAVQASAQDTPSARSSAEQNAVSMSAAGSQNHAAPLFATPAPASHAAVSIYSQHMLQLQSVCIILAPMQLAVQTQYVSTNYSSLLSPATSPHTMHRSV